ncbi:DUF6775 family putative metallopeptidase [Chloroflexota bacterium]
MKQIYLDYAATTPSHPEVVKAMQPYFTGAFGNPSSLYSCGQEARDAIEEARARITSLVGDPFCEDKGCRLYNAHWQEELIFAQLGAGYEFCESHTRLLERWHEK